MTYRQFINSLGEKLQAVGEEVEALIYAFKEKKHMTNTDFVLIQSREITPEDRGLLEDIYKALSKHQPVQYYLGYAYFKQLKLVVNSDVLIPRPETEELVDLILSENSDVPLTVLDIGTGSGAIALALKNKRPHWQITATDISKGALEIAKQNAHQLKLDINWKQSDVFSHILGKYDIIISNPPYISKEDISEVGLNVLTFEPHRALFADNNGYSVYEEIITKSPRFLKDKGRIYFEIGYKQGLEVRQLLSKTYPDKKVYVATDIYGKDRMVIAKND